MFTDIKDKLFRILRLTSLRSIQRRLRGTICDLVLERLTLLYLYIKGLLQTLAGRVINGLKKCLSILLHPINLLKRLISKQEKD